MAAQRKHPETRELIMLEFSRFDRRRYPTVSVREGYREWLPSYETTVEDEMDLVLLGALESVPWTAVEHAADPSDAEPAGRALGSGPVASPDSTGSI
jgi:hypothetical protein